MEDENAGLVPTEPSAVAADIDNLQATVKRLVREREVLPQPMFWSLFHTRLKSIRRQKELSRVVSQAFGESES